MDRNRPKSKQKTKKKSSLDFLMLFIISIIIITFIILVSLGIKQLIIPNQANQNTQEPKPTPESVLGVDQTFSELKFAEDFTRLDISPYLKDTLYKPANPNSIENLPIYQYGTMATIGNVGYEYYKFDKTLVDSFTETLNNSISKIDPNVEIHTMIVPSAVDIMLPMDFLEENYTLTSDQEKTIQYIYSNLNDRSINLELYLGLRSYCDEKLYFHTHNTWTSLGAYYGSKGFEINELSTYAKNSVHGFKGYISRFIGSDEVSKAENIDYYIPKSNLSMADYSQGDQTTEEQKNVLSLFPSVDTSEDYYKKDIFLGGTRDITKITNSSNTSGKKIVLVGDSYSYMLAPYIAENYSETYFVDYTLFSGDLNEFINSVNAEELLYCMKIETTISDVTISKID